jgi:hypothetical protein
MSNIPNGYDEDGRFTGEYEDFCLVDEQDEDYD